MMFPRQLEIIYEINRRFLENRAAALSRDEDRVRRVSLIEEGPERKIRMANSRSSARTAPTALPIQLRATCALSPSQDLAEIFPQRFGNAVGAVRADDRRVGHADLAFRPLLDQADAPTRSSSPGKRCRTVSGSGG